MNETKIKTQKEINKKLSPFTTYEWTLLTAILITNVVIITTFTNIETKMTKQQLVTADMLSLIVDIANNFEGITLEVIRELQNLNRQKED